MKVIKLVAENVKRIHAVSIEPDGTLVTIGGKNGAGKSSVLDSIAYALGGEKLVPSEPIRAGEAEAKIVVDLGDLVVTRKFKREKVVVPAAVLSGQPGDVVPERETWSETKSTLTVSNKDGARYPSPQAVLDRMLGKLTFDPLAFAEDGKTAEGRKRQDQTLRTLVGVDVTQLDLRRSAAAAERAMVKKTRDIKEAQLLALPTHKGVPEGEVSIDDISREMLKAEEYRKLAEDAEREVAKVESIIQALESQRGLFAEREAELKQQLSIVLTQINNNASRTEDERKTLDATKITAQSARVVVPDTAAIRQRLAEAEDTNNKVRANKRYSELANEVNALGLTINEHQMAIEAAETEKRRMLAEAKFPVPGLGLSDAGVTFNNVPFNQAGSAEQLRVSIAIGIALNPTLKVLLIRNGNLLDSDSLKAVAAQAEESGVQVWMEYVSESKDGVAVMMVDGEVAL